MKLGLSGSHGTPGSTRPLAEAPVHLGREVLRRRGERRGVLAHGRLHGPLVELRIDGRGARRRGRRGGLGRRDRRRLEGLDGRRGGGLHLRVPTIKELDGELCRLCNRAALTLQGADFAKPAGLGCLDLQSSPILRAQRRRGAGWTNRRPGFASMCRPGSRFALSQKFPVLWRHRGESPAVWTSSHPNAHLQGCVSNVDIQIVPRPRPGSEPALRVRRSPGSFLNARQKSSCLPRAAALHVLIDWAACHGFGQPLQAHLVCERASQLGRREHLEHMSKGIEHRHRRAAAAPAPQALGFARGRPFGPPAAPRTRAVREHRFVVALARSVLPARARNDPSHCVERTASRVRARERRSSERAARDARSRPTRCYSRALITTGTKLNPGLVGSPR